MSNPIIPTPDDVGKLLLFGRKQPQETHDDDTPDYLNGVSCPICIGNHAPCKRCIERGYVFITAARILGRV